MSVASELAEVDIARASSRPFSLGTRPVIRWIKGDGRDDEVTRSAIAQATRIFGDRVDYCMCSAGISAARARAILAWSDQPVEWWPLGPEDNLQLARMLMAAGCPVDAFGYWWKWFPERVRPAAPEWILDGDMVITGKPSWFDEWCAGTDRLRISQNEFLGHRRELRRVSRFCQSQKEVVFWLGVLTTQPVIFAVHVGAISHKATCFWS